MTTSEVFLNIMSNQKLLRFWTKETITDRVYYIHIFIYDAEAFYGNKIIWFKSLPSIHWTLQKVIHCNSPKTKTKTVICMNTNVYTIYEWLHLGLKYRLKKLVAIFLSKYAAEPLNPLVVLISTHCMAF